MVTGTPARLGRPGLVRDSSAYGAIARSGTQRGEAGRILHLAIARGRPIHDGDRRERSLWVKGSARACLVAADRRRPARCSGARLRWPGMRLGAVFRFSPEENDHLVVLTALALGKSKHVKAREVEAVPQY